MHEKQRGWRRIAAGLAVAAAVVMVPVAAHAEGFFTSSIQQAQPSFNSRTWTDNNNDGTSTTVSLSGCLANGPGGAPGSTNVSSVGIRVVNVDTGRAVSTITKACGSYNFGRLAAARYVFEIASINGYTSASRNVFLNVSSVRVDY